jgi:hypothetical protein
MMSGAARAITLAREISDDGGDSGAYLMLTAAAGSLNVST